MTTPKRRLALAMLGLVVLVFAVYWPALSDGFVYLDDPLHVLTNPVVTGGLTCASLVRAFQPYASLWTPLTWISHSLVVSCAGLDPRWHHLVNVVLHAGSVLLLFGWLVRVTQRFGVALAVAALFAVHPLNVENVVWVTERNHLLAMFFLLCGLHAYARHVEAERERDALVAEWQDAKKSGGWMRLTELAMLLSIMSKGTFFVFPALLLVLDAWPFERMRWENLRRLIFEKIGLIAVAIFSMIMTFSALGPGASSGGKLSLAFRVCVALTTLGWQLERLAVPYVLSPIHPPPAEVLWTEAAVSAVALLLVAYVGWRVRKRAPWVLAGLAWYLIVLTPLSGITQAGNTFFSDRFVYLPEVGIFLAAVYCCAAWFAKLRQGAAIGFTSLVVATVTYGATSHWYARQWKDTATLFTHATAVTKNNFIAHTTAALAFVRNGDLAGAVPHFEAGLRINPDATNFRFYYGQALASLRKDEEAASQFANVIARDPAQQGARFSLATVQLRLGRSGEALANLRILKEHLFTAPDLDRMIETAEAQAEKEPSPGGGAPKP